MSTGLALAACNAEAGSKKKKQALKASEECSTALKSRDKRDFSGDLRSIKVIFVPHCALNQNARIFNAADFPAMFEPLLEALRENQVGVIQFLCPELMALGLARRTVRDGLEAPEGQKVLKRLIADTIYIIKEYQYQGFKVVGILGKNGSPACGVTRTWMDGKQVDGEGVFIRMLRETLAEEGLNIGLLGVADHHQCEAIDWDMERL